MKCQRVLPACYLLLWTLAADKITVKTVSGGVRLTCEGTDAYFKKGEELVKSQELPYKDGASGEYTCVHNHSKSEEYIFVKFRTCDNCIEIDPASILGLAVGNVLATIVLGVAVYLVASQSGPVASHKKSIYLSIYLSIYHLSIYLSSIYSSIHLAVDEYIVHFEF
uniref:CD3 gamma/delta subunit Ig-like domain-containing protein n=1 Tax=Scophthalmus maximus TaxID=52904 RepID=A0A8D3CM40_SCOMX